MAADDPGRAVSESPTDVHTNDIQREPVRAMLCSGRRGVIQHGPLRAMCAQGDDASAPGQL
jgi:hypothetical protein